MTEVKQSLNKQMQQTDTKRKIKQGTTGGLIHYELCKRIKYGYVNKCYRHKPESFRNFEIQTDHPIPTRRPF